MPKSKTAVYQFPRQPEKLETLETAALVDQAALLKETITQETEDLRRINLILAERAEFQDGSKTGHLSGRHFSAKVQLKDNTKWEQPALETTRRLIGDDEFFKVFKQAYEPINAKTLAGALEFGRHAKVIAAARTVTPGAPYITFERMEDRA